MTSHLISVALAIASTACCPSLFLTVEKTEPAPRPAIPEPAVEATALPLPSHLDNRFIVNGSATSTYDGYAEYTDAPVSPAEESRALASLGEIAAEFGISRVPALSQDEMSNPMVGVLRCLPGQLCDEVRFDGASLVDDARVIEITGAGPGHATFLRGVMEYKERTPPAPGSASRSPAQGQAAGATPSTADPHHYYAVLRTGIPGGNGDHVTIRLSRATPHLSETLLTFIQLSDVQIRDSDVRIGDADLSRRLDWLIQSFEYDADLEFYNRYLVEALFATINAEVLAHGKTSRDRPAFVIHTGDAIDAGVTSEAREFHRLVDRLNIPFYDVLGNHDVLVFGNMMPTANPRSDRQCATAASIAGAEVGWLRRHPRLLPNKLCVNARVRCPGCLPGELRLVAAGRDGAEISHANAHESFMIKLADPQNDLMPQPPQLLRDPLSCPLELRVQAPTRRHGFDLDAAHLGYYAFAWEIQVPGEATPRNILSIALDTNDLKDDEGGAAGRIRKTQMRWLEGALSCAGPKDLVFVFGHHELSGIMTQEDTGNPATAQPAGELERILKAHKNVIAYFYGHHHEHQICRDDRPGVCSQFWEVQTSSVIEFPQEARRIKVKYAGKGLAFLELVTFHERLANTTDERAHAIGLARRGAERDWCRTHEDVRCSEDLRVYRTDGRDTHARLWFRLPGPE